jgi:hypothetical protein
MRAERARRLAAACALLALGCGAARAEVSPYSFGTGLTIASNDNLFLAPPGEAVSDRYTTTSLFGSLDQSLGRQRVRGSAAVRDNRYQDRDDLNYRGYNAQIGWNGATAGSVSWSVSYNANRNLSSYGDVSEPALRVSNVETNRQALAAVQLGLVSQWAANATLSHSSIDYSAPAYAQNELRLDSASLGAQWNPIGPLSLTLGPRFTRGRYPHARAMGGGGFEAESFDRHDLDLTLDWTTSGASSLAARLSLTLQRFDLLSDRDFSGATGQLNWHWRATGKTLVNAALSRDTGSQTSFFTQAFLGQSLRGTGDNSQLTNSLSAGVDHELTGKMSFNLVGRYSERRLANSSRLDLGGNPVEQIGDAGNDRSVNLALGLRYAPTRNSSLGCDYGHGRRSTSTGLSSVYRVNSVSCNGQLTLH